MKSLDQYPTPETAAALTAIYDADGFLDKTNAPEKLVALARKLERNLALCRDALKYYQSNPAGMPGEFGRIADETLKATEPNP